ncbi:MAG: hypothetical protein EB163_07825 [Nitrososphaeria archaeon]|nr:hypothetical protein [Nitrososphaeria archaeon]NDB47178.1 hypothetical protein [Nitrososphaeria archaeon]NDB92855.1 hypothetical protein [Nitrososphaeria archaeon]NDF27678.1 hypothetical protein [Nitrosopumilaceae archaeon]
MKFELYLIVVVGILVSGILYLVYLNPNEITYYNSFQSPEFDTFAGDYHLEPIGDNEKHWATISKVTLIDDQTIKVDFNANNYRIGNATFTAYEIPNEFEYTNFVKKGQTFISVCAGESTVAFLKYIGIVQDSESYYYLFFHGNAILPQGLTCKYPQIIQHGFAVDFNLNENTIPYKRFLFNGTIYNDASMVATVVHPCKVLECKS